MRAAAGGPIPARNTSQKHSYSNALLISAMSTVCIALLIALMCFWGWFLYKKYGNKKSNLAKVKGAEGMPHTYRVMSFCTVHLSVHQQSGLGDVEGSDFTAVLCRAH